jgi:hypothetical protein
LPASQVSQIVPSPTVPIGHPQVKPPMVFTQRAVSAQSSLSSAHSSTSSAHVVPFQPSLQAVQLGFLPSLWAQLTSPTQFAGLLQVLAQVSPQNPAAHAHSAPPAPALQVAPFWHGSGVHGSAVPHVGPEKPVVQAQLNEFTASVQVPPFSHGLGSQSSTLTHEPSAAASKPSSQAHIPSPSHRPLWQSVSARQTWFATHFSHSPPPQSTAVSVPLRTLSVHVAAGAVVPPPQPLAMRMMETEIRPAALRITVASWRH